MKRLLTRRELADELGVAVRTIKDWHARHPHLVPRERIQWGAPRVRILYSPEQVETIRRNFGKGRAVC